jgi:hypothetical protein
MMRGVIGRWIVFGVSLSIALGLGASTVGRTDAREAATWERLGPGEQAVSRLFTPTTGALFARTDKELYRSDDGGLTWGTVRYPGDTDVVTVSAADQQLLYAAGTGGVYRSQDGGGTWERMTALGDGWIRIEVSPADPSVVYGVAITSPPIDYGENRWHEFRVSHDAGATWETIRIHHEKILPGTQPCYYALRLLQPHSISTVRVLTIEGCTGRGMAPVGGMSPDEWDTVAEFPGGPVADWGASAIDGGRGVRPGRWYAAVYLPGVAYSRVIASKILRSDDDGVSWAKVFEADGGSPDRNTGKPTDFVGDLTYDPQHPDDVYAVFSHYEPSGVQFQPHKPTGFTVRRSRDAGVTWTDMGTEGIPPDAGGIRLTVGVDSHYLYAATTMGVLRIALTP